MAASALDYLQSTVVTETFTTDNMSRSLREESLNTLALAGLDEADSALGKPDVERSNIWPPRPPTAKNIVLCLDGTSKKFSAKNTNIMKIFDCLVKNLPDKQVVYYQTGVGTGTEKTLATPVTGVLSSIVDSAIGWYLDEHVIAAYRFVQEHYNEGDRICLFGFSRGAYTARALCGFLHAIGVLPRSNTQQVDYAYEIWKSGDRLSCTYYKRMMSKDVDIDFLGCFDTVSSVGAVVPRVLPFSTHNGKTRVFRHALALDEWRVKFRQETWHYKLPEKVFSLKDLFWSTLTAPTKYMSDYVADWFLSEDEKERRDLLKDLGEYLAEEEKRTARPVNIKEVWFAGGHADVGGGAVSDLAKHDLSWIPLRWMIKEAIKSESNILFSDEKLETYDMFKAGPKADDIRFYRDPTTGGPVDDIPESRKDDVAAPTHANLKLGWWPLEFLPFLENKQAQAGRWNLEPHVNLFQPRTIPKAEPPRDPDGRARWDAHREAGIPLPGPLFHNSVAERMAMKDRQEVYSRSWSSLFLSKGPYVPYAWPRDGVQPEYVE